MGKNYRLIHYYELYRQGKSYRKNWGKVKTEYIGDKRKNKLVEIANLISQILIEYSECNAYYGESANSTDFLMGWGELQNQGALFHSLYQALGPKTLIIPEFPYQLSKYSERKRSIIHKRIDYYTYLNERYVLLIEYKHTCVPINLKDLKEQKVEHNSIASLKGNLDITGWKSDINKFPKPENKRLIKEFSAQMKIEKYTIYKVVLWIVPIYHNEEDGEYGLRLKEIEEKIIVEEKDFK